MERLTEKHYLAEDHYMKCSEDCNVDMDCVDCPAFDKLIERLAAYEDTGLTPEEIKAPFTEDTMINLAAQALGVEPSRLRELAEADKDGRVVVLPCKVGETVYFARANPILQYKVTGYEMGEASISQVRSKHVDKETGLTFNFTFRPGSIGKTVFLSREEAEKALEEREGKKDGNETNM